MARRSPRIPARSRGCGDRWTTRHSSRRAELSGAADSARRRGCSGRRQPRAGGAAAPGRRKSWPIRKDQVEYSGMPCDVTGEAGSMPRPPSVIGAGTGGRPRRPARVAAGMLPATFLRPSPYGRIAPCGAQDRWPVRHRRSKAFSRCRSAPGLFSHRAPSDFGRTPAASPARRTPHAGPSSRTTGTAHCSPRAGRGRGSGGGRCRRLRRVSGLCGRGAGEPGDHRGRCRAVSAQPAPDDARPPAGAAHDRPRSHAPMPVAPPTVRP